MLTDVVTVASSDDLMKRSMRVNTLLAHRRHRISLILPWLVAVIFAP